MKRSHLDTSIINAKKKTYRKKYKPWGIRTFLLCASILVFGINYGLTEKINIWPIAVIVFFAIFAAVRWIGYLKINNYEVTNEDREEFRKKNSPLTDGELGGVNMSL